MSNQETVRIGIIGAGGIVKSRHLPALRAVAGVEVVAVCNRSRESGEAVAREWSIPEVMTDWRAMVERPDLDAVFIGTWPYTHAEMSIAALDAGADGLVLFNRFYQPDLDIEKLNVLSNISLSTNSELLLRLHWLAILSDKVHMSLAATGGVHGVADGIRALLTGAHAVQMVSAVLQQGPQLFREMQQGLSSWMVRHEYDSIDAFRGLANLKRTSDPAYFERANYLRMLQSWSR